MATVGTRLMTAEDFWAWWADQPDEDCRFELDRGQVVRIPLAGLLHGLVCGSLVGRLWEKVKQVGGYACSNNTGLLVSRAPDTLLGPDVMVFGPREPGEQMSDSFCTRVPLLIVEVLSADDTWTPMVRRVSQFLERGVPQIWVVDPEGRSVSVFRPGAPPQVLEGEDVLPDLTISVARLFERPGA